MRATRSDQSLVELTGSDKRTRRRILRTFLENVIVCIRGQHRSAPKRNAFGPQFGELGAQTGEQPF